MRKILILGCSLVLLNTVCAQKNPAKPDANWQKYLVDSKKGFRQMAVTLNFLEPWQYGTISAGFQYMPFKYFGIEAGAGFGIRKSGSRDYALNQDLLLPAEVDGYWLPEVEMYKPQSVNYLIFHFPLTHNAVDCFSSFGLFVRNRSAQVLTRPEPDDLKKNIVSSTNIGISFNSQFQFYRNILFGYSLGIGRENFTFKDIPHYNSGWGVNTYVRRDYKTKALDAFYQIKIAYAFL